MTSIVVTLSAASGKRPKGLDPRACVLTPRGCMDVVENANVFIATPVMIGAATMLAVHTGRASDIGRIAGLLVEAEPETAFARGLRCFALLIARVMMLLVQFDFLVNILFHRGSLEWVLFPLALAIGLTPELLPMISSATLAHGAVRVARKQVIVKRLPTINVATLLA